MLPVSLLSLLQYDLLRMILDTRSSSILIAVSVGFAIDKV